MLLLAQSNTHQITNDKQSSSSFELSWRPRCDSSLPDTWHYHDAPCNAQKAPTGQCRAPLLKPSRPSVSAEGCSLQALGVPLTVQQAHAVQTARHSNGFHVIVCARPSTGSACVNHKANRPTEVAAGVLHSSCRNLHQGRPQHQGNAPPPHRAADGCVCP